MPEPTDKCRTCGNSWGWHQEEKPIHPFNNGEAGATAFLKRRARESNDRQKDDQPPRMPMMTGDPVLRQALINKGVLTPEDFRAAEEMIRVVTAQVLGGGPWSVQGVGNTVSSIEIDKTSTEL